MLNKPKQNKHMSGFDTRTHQQQVAQAERHRSHELQSKRLRDKLAQRALGEQEQLRRSGEFFSAVRSIDTLAQNSATENNVRPRNIRAAAESLLENPESSIIEKNVARIYTVLPGFVEASRRLDSSTLPRSIAKTYKAHLSRFNSAIKEIIDTDSKVGFEEIMQYVDGAALTYGYSGESLTTIDTDVRISLKGTQHELAVEGALYRLGYDLDETDTTDDLNGIDVSTLRKSDGMPVYIDVKSSHALAERKSAERDAFYAGIGRTPPSNHLILASSFQDTDFTAANPWRPTEAAMQRVMPQLEAAIEHI
ncbi:MAG: hypothetical protein UY35_C0009G0005 [Candidatus Saccharibacteria bacterium GW2011_GWC2_48_9]|nr:MAG: hypothetical protein UY35_C0009G0005 [Candidatus Saccharibacteria bacterium GW2011_GWC2_48_9]HCH34092.1 hypothetical protein [Candidatus Saccharibacteria bacterium]